MKKRPAHPPRLALRFLEAGFALVFLGAVTHHVVTQDFKPLAAFCVPILVVFYGFASLLFARGRALAKGPWQVRSLYAGERALQATLWYLCGRVAAGGALVAAIPGTRFADADRLLYFMRALWAIAPELLRKGSAFEVARRVHERKQS